MHSGTIKADAVGRIGSIDALRGFGMLWIIGGGEVVNALAQASGNNFFKKIAGV